MPPIDSSRDSTSFGGTFIVSESLCLLSVANISSSEPKNDGLFITVTHPKIDPQKRECATKHSQKLFSHVFQVCMCSRPYLTHSENVGFFLDALDVFY